MKGFSDSETKKFITFIKNGISDGKDLTCLFKEYSKISGRAEGSLRNYYYKTIKKCKEDNKLKTKLGVSEKMYPIFIKTFNESEEEDLLKEVLLGLSQGKSVRSTICALANNKETLALRYQNKYRNLLRDKKELVLSLASTIKDKNGEVVNPYKNTVLSDEKSSIESEIDILIKRLYSKITKENVELKEKISVLERENKKLKDVFKKRMKENSISKDFFNSKKGDINAI